MPPVKAKIYPLTFGFELSRFRIAIARIIRPIPRNLESVTDSWKRNIPTLEVISIEPVSYTHLDVYKRQHMHFKCVDLHMAT